jgi:hypothetical protein
MASAVVLNVYVYVYEKRLDSLVTCKIMKRTPLERYKTIESCIGLDAFDNTSVIELILIRFLAARGAHRYRWEYNFHFHAIGVTRGVRGVNAPSM